MIPGILLAAIRMIGREHMDQWLMWKLKTPQGSLYFYLGREPFSGSSEEAYTEIE